MSRVHVGSYNWLHADWDRGFYPADIPHEWKLSYYANEFSAVVVPQQAWFENNDDFEEMAEDLGEDFALYFELKDTTPSVDHLLKCREQYAANFRGYLVRFVDRSFLQGLGEALSVSLILPFYLLGGEALSNFENWADTAVLNENTAIIKIDSSLDLRTQKACFESRKMAIRQDRDVLVLFDDMSPDVEVMRQTRIMLELMMIA